VFVRPNSGSVRPENKKGFLMNIHKYAGSDSVNVVLSSLQAFLLLGPATGVDVDVIHVYLY
jgi:hypothetical protein